jgi:C1A family cysteine protease
MKISKPLILISSLILLLNFQSCKKNTFYSQKFGLIAATDEELNGKDEIPSFPVGTLPSSASLEMPPIGNQGQQGSCAAWATGYAVMGYLMNKKNNTHYASNSELCSPSFLYNLYAKGVDNGSSIPSLLNFGISKGDCTLADMPYNDADCFSQPTSSQYIEAAKNKIDNWKLVNKNNLTTIKSCIVAKYPLVISVEVTENLYKQLSYPYIWYNKSGKSYGRHAIALVGYDDAKHAFKIQNSWGAQWGDHGHFWIDYDFFPQAVEGRECYIAFRN